MEANKKYWIIEKNQAFEADNMAHMSLQDLVFCVLQQTYRKNLFEKNCCLHIKSIEGTLKIEKKRLYKDKKLCCEK